MDDALVELVPEYPDPGSADVRPSVGVQTVDLGWAGDRGGRVGGAVVEVVVEEVVVVDVVVSL